jgi:cytochrome c biogenesis protein CcmG/thiol:disulfide interchange protein DsbE
MGRLRLFIPLIVFVALAALLWRGLALDPNYMPSALEDRPLPPFRLRTLDGRELGTQDLHGTPALLNVWATWCPSCAVEHAYLNTLAQQGVVIWGLNYKDDEAAARRWLEERGNPYRASLVDADGRTGLDLGVTGAPETYLVDATGVVRLRHQGPVDERVWRTVLQPALAKLGHGERG